MFQVERLEKIKQSLREKKSVDVIWLSSYLKVSEVTIRRDLEKLEGEGFLKRTYGGAILTEQETVHSAQQQVSHNEKFASMRISEKNRKLGEMCFNLIENYDVIFLGDCESNIALAEQLFKKTGVVVFSNSLNVLRAMWGEYKNKIILVGGEVNFEKSILCNEQVHSPFPDIRVNKAFLQFTGLDMEYGITTNYQQEATLYKEIKKRTKQMVAVVEGAAFDKAGLIQLGEMTDIDILVVDSEIPKAYKEVLYKKGVSLHQKFEL